MNDEREKKNDDKGDTRTLQRYPFSIIHLKRKEKRFFFGNEKKMRREKKNISLKT